MKFILHIDDSEDEELLFAEAIRQIDNTMEYRYISSGEKALSLLRSTPEMLPDIIFLDLNMPRMSGKEFLTAFRKIEKFKQIPVIIYTVSIEEKDRQETMELGATAFMSKHSSFFEMKNGISEMLKKYLFQPNASGKL